MGLLGTILVAAAAKKLIDKEKEKQAAAAREYAKKHEQESIVFKSYNNSVETNKPSNIKEADPLKDGVNGAIKKVGELTSNVEEFIKNPKNCMAVLEQARILERCNTNLSMQFKNTEEFGKKMLEHDNEGKLLFAILDFLEEEFEKKKFATYNDVGRSRCVYYLTNMFEYLERNGVVQKGIFIIEEYKKFKAKNGEWKNGSGNDILNFYWELVSLLSEAYQAL